MLPLYIEIRNAMTERDAARRRFELRQLSAMARSWARMMRPMRRRPR